MNGTSQVMWISVLEEYGGYLADDRCDAFVAALLPKALREGRDLVCRGPVSRQLLYQVNQYLIPILTANIDTFHPMALRAEAASSLPTAGNVCTGGTGGVDSMYSIFESLNVPEESRCRLSHLFLASNGAIEGGVLSETLELMADRARRQIIPGTGLDVLTIDSNLQDLLPEEVFICVLDFRHTAVMLALQKYFGTGLVSSAYSFSEFAFVADKNALCEFLILNHLSTKNTVFYSSGGAFSRGEKLCAIKDFPIAKRALHPCIYGTTERNCGKCPKCTKTEALLYAMGKLGDFSAVFDPAAFARKRYYFLAQMIYAAWCDPQHSNHYTEVIEYMKKGKKTLWPAYVIAGGAFLLFRIPGWMVRQCKKWLCGKKQGR